MIYTILLHKWRGKKDLNIGDEAWINLKVRVVKVEDDLVDVTSWGEGLKLVSGEREATLVVTQVEPYLHVVV